MEARAGQVVVRQGPPLRQLELQMVGSMHRWEESNRLYNLIEGLELARMS